MKVADAIAQWLHDKSVTHAFGIVGGGNVALWDAITRLGKTQIICTHHEQAAVMAAAYYYRTSRRLCLALVTTGAGSTNTLTGLASAWMDSIPVLVISGNDPSKYLDTPTRVKGTQAYESADFARPFCKYAARAMADDWRVILDTFHTAALKPRQGPVWCDVPKNVQSAV